MVTSWNVLASYSRQSLSGRRIPAAAMQTSMRPSLSPMSCPICHIAACHAQMSTYNVLRRDIQNAHLVRNVRTNILETAFSALVFEACSVRAHLLPLFARFCGEIYAVYGACTGLYERECALKPDTPIPAGDEGDAVRKRELVLEERGRWCGICRMLAHARRRAQRAWTGLTVRRMFKGRCHADGPIRRLHAGLGLAVCVQR